MLGTVSGSAIFYYRCLHVHHREHQALQRIRPRFTIFCHMSTCPVASRVCPGGSVAGGGKGDYPLPRWTIPSGSRRSCSSGLTARPRPATARAFRSCTELGVDLLVERHHGRWMVKYPAAYCRTPVRRTRAGQAQPAAVARCSSPSGSSSESNPARSASRFAAPSPTKAPAPSSPGLAPDSRDT